MKKRMILMMLLISLFGVSNFFTGCKKKDTTTTTPSATTDTETPADETLADNTFTDVDNIGNEAALNQGAGKTGGTYFYIRTQCATLSLDSNYNNTPNNWRVIVDFGTTGCLCADGKIRSGQIIVTWSGHRYLDSGNLITYTLNNYVVNDLVNTYKVAGNKTVRNIGRTSSGQPQWHIVVTGGQITRESDNAVATYSSDRIRTWTVGYNSPFLSPSDQFLISNGDNSVTDQGTSFKGVAYTVTITTPLLIDMSCKYFITSGVLSLTEGANVVTVNYGTNCSPTITGTYDGYSFSIVRP